MHTMDPTNEHSPQPRSLLGAILSAFSAPWTWPLPALAILALVLISSDTVWVETMKSRSRYGGQTTTMTVGTFYLVSAAFCAGLYWLSILVPRTQFMTVMFGAKGLQASEGEAGIALWLLRLMLLAAVYLVAFAAFSR